MFLHKCGDGAETIWAYLFRYVGWLTLNLDDNVPNRYEFEIPNAERKSQYHDMARHLFRRGLESMLL